MGSLYNPRGVMSIRIEDLLDREKFKEEMIQLRRVFHQFPELSQHESQTAERICKFLDNIGVPYKKQTTALWHGYREKQGLS